MSERMPGGVSSPLERRPATSSRLLPSVDPQDRRQDGHPTPGPDQMACYGEWFETAKRTRGLVAELEALSLRAGERTEDWPRDSRRGRYGTWGTLPRRLRPDDPGVTGQGVREEAASAERGAENTPGDDGARRAEVLLDGPPTVRYSSKCSQDRRQFRRRSGSPS